MPGFPKGSFDDGRPVQRKMRVIEKVAQAAAAARFSALGYYVVTNMELPQGYGQVADIVGIKPILKQLKNRNVMGPAPAGVLCWLDYEHWALTETVIEASRSDKNFIRGVLMESEGKGWVEKRVVADDVVEWRLKDYRYPAREAFIARCGSASPLEAFQCLKDAGKCCNILYLILDYGVNPEFMDMCLRNGVGLLEYIPRNGYFRELLASEYREIEDRKGFMSLCEKVLFENHVLRKEEVI